MPGVENEAQAESPAGEPSPGWWQKVKGAGEILLAIVVAGFGLWHVGRAGNDPSSDMWGGLALVGLAFVFYLMRGQVLQKATLGPDGISFEMKVNTAIATASRAEEKAESAAASGAAAQETAVAAKQLALQSTTPGGKPPTASEGDAKAGAKAMLAESAPDWAHPELEREEAPETDPDDPQKGRWGGSAIRNNRRLSATVEPIGDDFFEVTLTVQPDGGPPIENAVRFHLHDTFPRMVRIVEPEDGKAKLTLSAWGAFTVGAEVRCEPGTYLELDLADKVYGYPEKFISR